MSYYESNLPRYLQRDLDAFKEGKRSGSTLLDCLWGELYGSINACQWNRSITRQEAEYPREKYL